MISFYFKGGGRSIPDYLKDAINNHLANNSINKTSTNGVVKTTSSSDHVDIMSLYKSFPFKNQLAKSTFFKYAKRSDKHGYKTKLNLILCCFLKLFFFNFLQTKGIM